MLANPITLKNYLNNEKDAINIPEYLVKITKFSSAARQTIEYSKLVYDLYVKRELIKLTVTLVPGDKVNGTNLVTIDEAGSYRILGTSSWSGQASEGVYTPESVSNLDYEIISYTSNLGEFPSYLTTEGDKGIVIFVHGFRGDYSREVFALMRSGDLNDLGYRSMIISYRNDRGVPKYPSGI